MIENTDRWCNGNYSYKRNEKLVMYTPQYLFFSPILHSETLFVGFIFIQFQRNLLSAYKYGGPEVQMK